MTKRPTATFADLRSWNPCWGAKRIDDLEAQHEGKVEWTALDVLALDDVSIADRFWAVCNFEEPALLRLWACDCAERVQPADADPRGLEAIAVARRFAAGMASEDELAAAWSAAWSAAWDSTAWSAAWSAAYRAAYRAAGSAAGSARDSARDSAAWSAAAGSAAAGSAEQQWQLDALRRRLRAGS